MGGSNSGRGAAGRGGDRGPILTADMGVEGLEQSQTSLGVEVGVEAVHGLEGNIGNGAGVRQAAGVRDPCPCRDEGAGRPERVPGQMYGGDAGQGGDSQEGPAAVGVVDEPVVHEGLRAGEQPVAFTRAQVASGADSGEQVVLVHDGRDAVRDEHGAAGGVLA